MRIRNSIWVGVGIVSLLMTSSVALYYRGEAARYEHDLSAARAALATLSESPAPPAPAAPAPRPGSIGNRPPDDAESGAPPRRAPELQVVQEDAPTATAAPRPPRASDAERFGRRSQDWMENLRTNDPERYAEMQQRREERLQNMQNAWVQTTNYFMSRDTSRMSQSDVEEYNTMISLLGQAWSLSQQLQSGLPPEARQETMTQLRSNVVAVMPLLDNERNREYYDLALAMGQSEDTAAALVNSINQIASNTSLRAVLPGVRLGGMGGGPPPGRNPPVAVAPAK